MVVSRFKMQPNATKCKEYRSPLKFMFSKKDIKIEEIFTVDLTVTTYCQIDGEDFFNLCGLLRKCEL